MHLALRPFELARHAVNAVPTVVGSLAERGCAQLADAPAQIRRLQSLGEMAVAVGRRRLRRTFDARFDEARRNAGDLAERTFGNGCAPMPTSTRAATPTAAPAPLRTSAGPAAASGLPIPDYDELTASQVASRLAGLSADELDAVRYYETANRARKTVLAAVDRQRSS